MNGPTAPTTHRPPKAAILAVPLVLALVLTLFAWPQARVEPRDLPIGVAGPPAPAAALEARLAGQEGAFELKRYRDEAAARAAIEDREVYGAFVADPEWAQGAHRIRREPGGLAAARPMPPPRPAPRPKTWWRAAGTRWRWARRCFRC